MSGEMFDDDSAGGRESIDSRGTRVQIQNRSRGRREIERLDVKLFSRLGIRRLRPRKPFGEPEGASPRTIDDIDPRADASRLANSMRSVQSRHELTLR